MASTHYRGLPLSLITIASSRGFINKGLYRIRYAITQYRISKSINCTHIMISRLPTSPIALLLQYPKPNHRYFRSSISALSLSSYQPHRYRNFDCRCPLTSPMSDLWLDRDHWSSFEPTIHDQSIVAHHSCLKPDSGLSIRISVMQFNPNRWSSRSNSYCVSILHFSALLIYLDFTPLLQGFCGFRVFKRFHLSLFCCLIHSRLSLSLWFMYHNHSIASLGLPVGSYSPLRSYVYTLRHACIYLYYTNLW